MTLFVQIKCSRCCVIVFCVSLQCPLWQCTWHVHRNFDTLMNANKCGRLISQPSVDGIRDKCGQFNQNIEFTDEWLRPRKTHIYWIRQRNDKNKIKRRTKLHWIHSLQFANIEMLIAMPCLCITTRYTSILNEKWLVNMGHLVNVSQLTHKDLIINWSIEFIGLHIFCSFTTSHRPLVAIATGLLDKR